MNTNTAIEWTDATWNPVTGCTKVSPACQHCYAETIAHRFAGKPAFPNGFAVTLHPERLEQPLRTKKPSKIFAVSMGDLFHAFVPVRFRCAVLGIMAFTPQHTHQVLTKRVDVALGWFRDLGSLAENVRSVFPDESLNWRRWHVLRAAAIGFTGKPLPSIPEDPPWPLPNVWFGATTENQEMADLRIPLLLQVPSAVRFVSVEPMLGPVYLEKWWLGPERRCGHCQPPERNNHQHFYGHEGPCCLCKGRGVIGGLDWVICGGESGPHARPMHPDWARSLRDQCQAAGVPFFFKQWGEWVEMPDSGLMSNYSKASHRFDDPYACVFRLGRTAAGDLLDGVQHKAFPEARS